MTNAPEYFRESPEDIQGTGVSILIAFIGNHEMGTRGVQSLLI